MSVTPQLRGTWAAKLGRQAQAAVRAQEDLLVAVHEATQAGVAQRDIAHMIGDKSKAGIAAKAAKGKAIAEGRRRR